MSAANGQRGGAMVGCARRRSSRVRLARISEPYSIAYALAKRRMPSWMAAGLMKLASVATRFSWSLARRRLGANNEKVRSATECRGRRTKPFMSSNRLSISVRRLGCVGLGSCSCWWCRGYRARGAERSPCLSDCPAAVEVTTGNELSRCSMAAVVLPRLADPSIAAAARSRSRSPQSANSMVPKPAKGRSQ